MIEDDTIKLLRECDSGIKMGIGAINDVLKYVRSELFRRQLVHCSVQHSQLEAEIEQQLCRFQDEGKEPCPVSKGMSWMKTNVRLVMNESDSTIADLITDGCDMGTKSLSRYLNQYKAADEVSKDIAKRLIAMEDDLRLAVRGFL
jgi:Tfp pilus assembly pilus retraction ATPase PilT